MDMENKQCFWLGRFEDLASSTGLGMREMAEMGSDGERELQAARCAVCSGIDLACQYYLPLFKLGEEKGQDQSDGLG